MKHTGQRPTEEKLKPKLFSVIKDYSVKQFTKDVTAGIIVAIIALPLSIALALASGVNPEQGLYTAIVAGFIVSLLGGSRVQIAGPTAAFATIVAGIVVRQGMDGLIIATVMAGILMVIMGLCRFGSLIKYIPGTITAGFTFGIAVTIVVGQIKDFLGLRFTGSPIETVEKIAETVNSIGTFNWQAFLVGAVSLAILILWPKKLDKIPASLIAVILSLNGFALQLSGMAGLRECLSDGCLQIVKHGSKRLHLWRLLAGTSHQSVTLLYSSVVVGYQLRGCLVVHADIGRYQLVAVVRIVQILLQIVEQLHLRVDVSQTGRILGRELQ